MSLAPGSRIGPYEILGSVGAGGMGEVYRGRDTRLGRDAAIKILPANFAKDADRLARFEREARTLASLNHPNIAQVYGFEDGALIMELLEGETLRDRLRNGALPARKAIEYATQIARGLAAAHDRGIIHRDLKPENIFLLKDGQVKLLDFGLARPIHTAVSGATETVPAVAGTDPGTVLGTVGYMSPEQVRAETVDARSDLFSLGAVLYEMLTGERAFRRATNAETMTAILREDPPDLSSSRADISPAIDRIVRHAIEKNPVERFQTARDIAFALDSLSGSASTSAAASTGRSPISRERLAWIAVTILLGALVAWQGLTARRPATTTESYHVDLAFPDEVRTADGVGPVYRLAISRDGSKVAFAGVDPAGQHRLWVISLRDGSVQAINDIGLLPAFSPDGSYLLYSYRHVGGPITKRLNLTTGATETLGEFGGMKSWSPSGAILITAVGQEAQTIDLASPGSPPRKVGDVYGVSSLMPDGRHFLAAKFGKEAQPDAVYLASMDSPETTRLIDGSAGAWYANGTIAFVRGSTVYAQRFDERRAVLVGEPVVITEGIAQSTSAGQAITGSLSGTLVLQRPEPRGRTQLRWYRRDGSVESTVSDTADYSNAELSPDGRRLLISVPDPRGETRDLFIVDLQRGVRQRLTFDAADERSGVWSADGQRVFYRGKDSDLYVRRADFTGVEQPVLVDGKSKDPYGMSADGRLIAYRVTGTSGSNDVMIVPADGKGAPIAVTNTGFDENGGSFSPDGKSIVYTSDASGQPEVYVASIDNNGGRLQISTNGGGNARWVRNGKEIFYLSADQQIMAVPVSGSGATFQAGTPQRLFRLESPQTGGIQYDVSSDGQRIIGITSIDATSKPRLTAIINWPALVPQ